MTVLINLIYCMRKITWKQYWDLKQAYLANKANLKIKELALIDKSNKAVSRGLINLFKVDQYEKN